MDTQLVQILPREIKFIFEEKKQSSCVVHLANVTKQYVAFKVKTTSPTKYCVKPNVGIIKPKSTYDFTVTSQPQKYASSDMLSKDKFLIQSTVVPFGTEEEEILPGMFVKGTGNYIEETKIPVVTKTPNSLEKLQVRGILNQEESYETSSPEKSYSPVLLPVNGVSNHEPSCATPMPEAKLQDEVENLPPLDMLMKEVVCKKIVENTEESVSQKVKDNVKLVPVHEETYVHKDGQSGQVTGIEPSKLKLIEELKLKISALDAKLIAAECTVGRLQEEKMSIIHGKEKLLGELAMSRSKGGERTAQVGFPPLFVCMVALISLTIGFIF